MVRRVEATILFCMLFCFDVVQSTYSQSSQQQNSLRINGDRLVKGRFREAAEDSIAEKGEGVQCKGKWKNEQKDNALGADKDWGCGELLFNDTKVNRLKQIGDYSIESPETLKYERKANEEDLENTQGGESSTAEDMADLSVFFMESGLSLSMSIQTQMPTPLASLNPTMLRQPPKEPSYLPTPSVTQEPSVSPLVTSMPSNFPVRQPSFAPTKGPIVTTPPTGAPVLTSSPTKSPITPTPQPSPSATSAPTTEPTIRLPTSSPSLPQTSPPTLRPSVGQTSSPTKSSTAPPTGAPTRSATVPPTRTATAPPTRLRTAAPTQRPTVRVVPTKNPSSPPTGSPTVCNPPITEQEREAQLLDIIDNISPRSQINTNGTPRNKAFNWLVNTDEAQVCPSNELDVIQRYILALLYFSTDGNKWFECSANPTSSCRSVRYLSPQDECLWFNVTCDGPNGNLIDIALEDNDLNGTIPFEIGYLSDLEQIVVDRNRRLVGTIPATLGMLSQLDTLELSQNSLTGSIPSELFNAASLTDLDLSINMLSGPIPTQIEKLSMLNMLMLNLNSLSGTLPTQLGELDMLRYLILSNNDLTGTIPSTLSLLTGLQVFDTMQNMFEGTIPTFFGSIGSLQTINLFDNNLEGTVPTQLGLLTNLQYLFLHFNDLTGTMPSQVCNLLTDGSLLQLTADCDPVLGTISCDCCTACFSRP